MRGDEAFTVELLGNTHRQAPFRYQVKCLRWLREDLASLDAQTTERVRKVLQASNCWQYLLS